MTSETELKPCPFCGGNGHVSMREICCLGGDETGKRIRTGVQVICGRCKARGGLVSAVLVYGIYDPSRWRYVDELKEKAIELWNRRATNDATGD